MTRDPESKARQFILDNGPCIRWEGFLMSNGYGRTTVGGKLTTAHRVVWEVEIGPIPKPLVIDHLCRNRACINTDHMRIVTDRENLLSGNGWSGRNARKTHCRRRHPLAGANLIVVASGRSKGARGCRACHCLRLRRYRERHS